MKIAYRGKLVRPNPSELDQSSLKLESALERRNFIFKPSKGWGTHSKTLRLVYPLAGNQIKKLGTDNT